jgi:hypothetical protein
MNKTMLDVLREDIISYGLVVVLDAIAKLTDSEEATLRTHENSKPRYKAPRGQALPLYEENDCIKGLPKCMRNVVVLVVVGPEQRVNLPGPCRFGRRAANPGVSRRQLKRLELCALESHHDVVYGIGCPWLSH